SRAVDDVALLQHHHVGVGRGHLERRVLVPVRRREYDLRAFPDHALHHAGRVVVLGDVLRGQHLEVAERLRHGLATLVGGVVVAVVALGSAEEEAVLGAAGAGGGGPAGARLGGGVGGTAARHGENGHGEQG